MKSKRPESKNTPQSESDQPTESRRKTLKATLLGGGLVGATTATQWSKPVVDSVILPSHANTTGSGGDGGEGEDMQNASYFDDVSQVFDINDAQRVNFEAEVYAKAPPIMGDSIVDNLIDVITPVAEAQPVPAPIMSPSAYMCCSTSNGGDTYSVDFTVMYPGSRFKTSATIVHEGSGPLGATIFLTPQKCPFVAFRSYTVILSNPTSDYIDVELLFPEEGSENLRLPFGSCRSFTQECPIFPTTMPPMTTSPLPPG
ncbi:MAG: hypothetical protein AAF402_03705 [Pseudomonadota bacterium]